MQDLIYPACTLMDRCFFGWFSDQSFDKIKQLLNLESPGLKTGRILHFNFFICINLGCQITSGCFRRARYSSFINLLKILLEASGGQQTKDVYVAGYLPLLNLINFKIICVLNCSDFEYLFTQVFISQEQLQSHSNIQVINQNFWLLSEGGIQDQRRHCFGFEVWWQLF